MRLALRVAWRSVSQSRHRVPLVVGSPQPMQGRGIGTVHLRSRCLSNGMMGKAICALSGRRGGGTWGRCMRVVGSLQMLMHLECDRFDGVAIV